MSLANLYKSFLDDAYHKILKACVEDEAVITLKTIEDSECLLLRVNELFAEVYVEER